MDIDESSVQQLVSTASSIDNPEKWFAAASIKVFPGGEVSFTEGHEQQYFTSVGCRC